MELFLKVLAAVLLTDALKWLWNGFNQKCQEVEALKQTEAYWLSRSDLRCVTHPDGSRSVTFPDDMSQYMNGEQQTLIARKVMVRTKLDGLLAQLRAITDRVAEQKRTLTPNEMDTVDELVKEWKGAAECEK